jgi:hypothetical protein
MNGSSCRQNGFPAADAGGIDLLGQDAERHRGAIRPDELLDEVAYTIPDTPRAD